LLLELELNSKPSYQLFTTQFSTVTFVKLVSTMPTPGPPPGPVIEYPAQSRVMPFAPIVKPVLVVQIRLPVSVVLVVMMLPQVTAA